MRSIAARAMSVVLLAVWCIGVSHPGSVQATVDIATFHGQIPARLLDTRLGAATADGGFAGVGAIGSGGSTTVTVVGRGGIPESGVGAVALNVTVIKPAALGFLTVHPSGVSRPLASNVNFVPGQTVANMVVVSPGADGQVVVFNGSDGGVDVAVDVLGWFPTGASFTGVTPARVLETRSGAPTIDGLFSGIGALAAGATSSVAMLGRGGVPLVGVGAVALNVTATGPSAAGYLTVFSTGSTMPATSNLNYSAGQTVANMVIVPVGADGQVSIFNGSAGGTGVIADVLGWFPTGPAFSGLAPARLMDSRRTSLTVDGRFGGGGAIRQASTFNLVVAGRGSVPTENLGAVALNVTVANPTAAGYLTVFPQGAVRPLASNLNFVAGQTVANMVIVPVGHSGQVSIFNSTGDSNIIVDVVGWFPNPTNPATQYGTDLVLRPDGIGSATFGDPEETAIAVLTAVFGTPTSDHSDFYTFWTPPYRRHICFAEGVCVTFEGDTSTVSTFTGWAVFGSGQRLVDANGLSIGARGSDFPGAIISVDAVNPGYHICIPELSGDAASGLHLRLNFDGVRPTSLPSITPAQRDVTVAVMGAGSSSFSGGVCM